VEGGAQEGGGVQVAPEEAAGPTFGPLALANVHGEAMSARALSEAIYKREVSDIAAASSPSEAHRIAAGLSKCAAFLLVRCPDGEAFYRWRGHYHALSEEVQRHRSCADPPHEPLWGAG
jgi:hypothetical protein